MKEIVVIGTGYVGSVTGACLAAEGHSVTLVDNVSEKVDTINEGRSPIVEDGLEAIIDATTKEGNLRATTDLGRAVSAADVVLLALPTPSNEDGSADMHYVFDMAAEIGPMIKPRTVVATRSTVPVGTTDKVRSIISDRTSASSFFAVSNPEFLAEGTAVKDTMRPSRVVVGADEQEAIEIMREVYRPFLLDSREKFVAIDPRSSELSKLAANTMLAAQIAVVNVIAELAEKVGANYELVRNAVRWDERLGSFLYAGPGFGGSCFDKDVKSLATIATENDVDASLITTIIESNEHQKDRLAEKVITYFGGDVSGRKIALWGLAFKKGTDDIRQSPALKVIDVLTEAGAEVAAYDPEAMPNVARYIEGKGGNPNLTLVDSKYDATDDADALIIATDWGVLKSPDPRELGERMKGKNVFDGRAIIETKDLINSGFYVNIVGRSPLETTA
jgi:UDPglucose 6-dehydrogenase